MLVKAHSGNLDNEDVDELAKSGTKKENVFDTRIPKNSITNVVLLALNEQWNEDWGAYDEARMSKKWYTIQDKYRAKEVIYLSRLKLGRLIRIILGHNAL